MAATNHAHALPADKSAPDRVLHYELPWMRFAWCTLRRPPRLLVFEVVWATALLVYVATLWQVAAASGPSFPIGLKLLLSALVAGGTLRQLWLQVVTAWTEQGASDRVARMHGDTLIIGDGPTSRTYDLARVKLRRVGDWVRVTAPRACWPTDDVPTSLFAGRPPGHVRVNPGFHEPPPAAVVFGTTWRDARSDAAELLRRRPTMLNVVPIIAVLAAAIASPSHGSMVVAMLAVFTLIRANMQFSIWLGPLWDPYRGVAAWPTEDGLRIEDDGFIATVRWARIRVGMVGPRRITVPPFGTLRARRANAGMLDDVTAAVRQHASMVTESSAEAVRPGWKLVMWPIRTIAALVGFVVIALLGSDATSFGSLSAVVFGSALIAMLVIMVPGVLYVAVASVVQRPGSLHEHHRDFDRTEHDDAIWSLRDLGAGSIVVASAPLLAAGAVLLVCGELGFGAVTAALGLLVLLASQYALPDLHRETALCVASSVAACAAGSFVLLSTDGHPDMTTAVAAGTAAALLVLAYLAHASDQLLVPLAELRGSIVCVMLLAAMLGSAGALVHLAQQRIPDVADVESIVANPTIADTSLRGVRLEDAFADVERVTVTWSGDTPRLRSPTRMFDERGGALARQRLVAVLREAAAEPGPRPAVREIVFTTSWYGVAANHAVNEISGTGSRWPEAAAEWIRAETTKNDWISRYYHAPRRIVISRRESANLLRDLPAPPGTVLDERQAYSFHVLRHEIEHGMSSRGGKPRWIVEASAELLTQWAGRDTAALEAASFEQPLSERMYGKGYERWGRLMYSVLETCRMSPDIPERFDDAARLLRDDSTRTTVQLARCLERNGRVDRDGLVDLLERAGSDDAAYDELVRQLSLGA